MWKKTLQHLPISPLNLLPLIVLPFLYNVNRVESSGKLQFSYESGFSSPTADKIAYYGSVQFSNSTMWMLYNLTTPQPSSGDILGRAAYDQPIAFAVDSSFNTNFTFQVIVTGGGGGRSQVDCPSGLTFFFSPDKERPPDNSGGRYLGLVDNSHLNTADSPTDNTFYAVVFDMTKDAEAGFNDPSNSYVGIDISSLNPGNVYVDTSNSTTTGFFPEFFLCSNSTFSVAIFYNASSQITDVWMTNLYPARNYTRILNHKQDLFSAVFRKSSAWYAGFTATNYKVGSPPARVAILSWSFNVDNTGSIPASGKPQLKMIIVLVAGLGLCFVIAACTAAFVVFSVRRSRADSGNRISINVESVANLQKFSYRKLKASTRGFDPDRCLIAEGGYSKVYRGTLPDGSVVAIKRLKDSLRKEEEFISELHIISSIKHRNLLQLQGWSYEKGEALLVYNFMSNGSLETYLFGSKKGTLNGDTRLRILQGAAAALEYLHSGLGECILHRDVKAANVLLTEDFEPVLGDFGLARLIKHNEIVTSTMVGTPGYVAPEIFMTGKVTDKADVYSFGILMLEAASGSPAINRSLEAEHLFLVEWVSRLHSTNNVLQALDPTILQMCSQLDIPKVEEQWKLVIQLALMCCHPSPDNRPAMRYVNQFLNNDIINLGAGEVPCLNFNSMSPKTSHEAGYIINYLNFSSRSSQTLDSSNFTSFNNPSSNFSFPTSISISSSSHTLLPKLDHDKFSLMNT